MLPGGIRPKDLTLEKVEKGLYVVRNAYKGEPDDFFANSPLFPDEPQPPSSPPVKKPSNSKDPSIR